MAVLRPPRGPAAGLVAGALACAVTTAGWLALNTALGGSLTLDFVATASKPAVALGFLLGVAVAPAVLLAPRAGRERRRAVWPVAVGAGVALAVTVVAARSTLYPASEVAAGAGAAVQVPQATGAEVADALYVTAEVPALARAFLGTGAALEELGAAGDATPAQQAQRVETELLPLVRSALAGAVAYRTTSDRARSAHRHAIAALSATETAYTTLARAMRAGDTAALTRVQAANATAAREREAWLSAVARLSGQGPSP